MITNTFKNKKIIITGHTGFKGSWLAVWLNYLGAKVVGISRDIPTSPSLFEELSLSKMLKNYQFDIVELEKLKKTIHEEKPDYIFHLAAQAIVSKSYVDPVDTFKSNVIGTMNVLESLRDYSKPCSTVLITSDKCYFNKEWVWGYKESDEMGGKDIYSGSKGAAELLIKSYISSFFSQNHPVKIGIGRAGNVIGGGDWAKDRIVVDCMIAWNKNNKVQIRSPHATRPWQHVLEPLSGYINLAVELVNNNFLHGEAFNFGPKSEQNRKVIELIDDISKYWKKNKNDKLYSISQNIKFSEAGLLKLNCDKALSHLNWEPTLNYEETIDFVSSWYFNFYKGNCSNLEFTINQLENYLNLAKKRNREWVK